MSAAVKRVGPLLLTDAIGVIFAVATVSLSFVSFVPQEYLTVFIAGANAFLTAAIPAIAAALSVAVRVRQRDRVAGFTPVQLQFVAAVGATIGWLNVAWAGTVAFLGLIIGVLWVAFVILSRFIPALREPVTASSVAAVAYDGNIFPAVAAEPAPAASATPAPAPDVTFWVLVPDERPVVDDNGKTLFTVGPTAWALAVRSDTTSLRIRDFSGAEGQLTDVTGVIRN